MFKIQNLLDFFFPKLMISSGGGGGGGSGSGTQTQISELPAWARGYAKDTLEKTAALTEKPYQTYGGDRIAGFSPLQQQAFEGAGPQGFQKTIGSYMSPYMQNVTEMQQRNAREQAGIQAGTLNAKAAQQGAFGGSGLALQRAAQDRALQRQLGDIQATGLQNAFQAGTQQYNVGQQQLSSLGAQQQALQQRGLDVAYQDFQNQQNYPYKQLGFMSDMIRGLPVGQATTRQMYEPEPGFAQQIGSLGMGAYGLSKFMAADGGLAHSYAEGGMAYADGGSVDAPDNVQRIVSKLSDQQLQQAAQAAQARGDADQLEAIQSEMAMRASERNGLAGAVTNEMADRMAGGGIVAFAKGGASSTLDQLTSLAETDLSETPEQRMAGIKAALPDIQAMYGKSVTEPYLEEVKKERAGLGKMKEQGEGLAFLAASQALLRPGSKSRAIAGAMGAFGTEIVKMDKEQREADRALRQSEITLATAEQARKDGQIGKAESLYDKAQAQKKEGLDRKLGVLEKKATIQAGMENAQTQAAATLGKKTDLEKQTQIIYESMIEAGKPANKATMAAAANAAADQLGKYPGSARAEAATAKAVAPEVEMALMRNKDYQKAMKENRYEDAANIRTQIVNSIKPAPQGQGGPAPTQQAPSAAPIKVTTEAQFAKLPSGTTFIAPDGSTRVKP